MASAIGNPDDRLIAWSELKNKVPYTRQSIWRLERAGKFPRRVRLGSRRIAWVASEIEAWIEEAKAKRGGVLALARAA